MDMIRLVKALLPKSAKSAVKHLVGVQDMETRLRNLKRAGFACSGAVDVGAYAGEWALLAREVFACPVLMIEPQPDRRSDLEQLVRQHGFELETVAMSGSRRSGRLLLESSNSRLMPDDDENNLPQIAVQVERLDDVLQRHPALQPNLLKVDVQGHELAVLEGAASAMRQMEVVVLEVSLIRIGPVPLFREVIEHMAARGFRLYDFLPTYYRPLDGALWQGDAFFVRDDSNLVASEAWA
jgi:FkbM family methyltransferase